MVEIIGNPNWRLLGKTLVAALLGFTIWVVAFRLTSTVLALVLAIIILTIMHFVEGYLTSNSSV